MSEQVIHDDEPHRPVKYHAHTLLGNVARCADCEQPLYGAIDALGVVFYVHGSLLDEDDPGWRDR